MGSSPPALRTRQYGTAAPQHAVAVRRNLRHDPDSPLRLNHLRRGAAAPNMVPSAAKSRGDGQEFQDLGVALIAKVNVTTARSSALGFCEHFTTPLSRLP
jgi:hypothetical protein